MAHLAYLFFKVGIGLSDPIKELNALGGFPVDLLQNFIKFQSGVLHSFDGFVCSFNPCCYSAEAGRGHFCRTLTVIRKIRLCLHPVSGPRVQSLHLPNRLGSALSFVFSFKAYNQYSIMLCERTSEHAGISDMVGANPTASNRRGLNTARSL